MERPKTSYQTKYFAEDGTVMMRVHVNDDPESDVYFDGPEHWYDGSATHSIDLPLGYRTGSYKRYMDFIGEFGEHPEVTKARFACYKADYAEPKLK